MRPPRFEKDRTLLMIASLLSLPSTNCCLGSGPWHGALRRLIWSLLLLSVLATTSVLRAAELPAAQPGHAGLSAERLARIRPAMERQIREEHLPGAVCLVARRGKVAYLEAFGLADKEAGKPMRKDCIFRLFSMTKAVTAVAAMTLYEEGRFSLTDPVSQYLPEFRRMEVTVEQTNAPGGKRAFAYVPASHPMDDS